MNESNGPHPQRPREITIRFADLGDDTLGWWDPVARTVMVLERIHGRQLAETLLHEIGHIVCEDDGLTMTDADEEWLERWTISAAGLLELVREVPWARVDQAGVA